MGFSNKHHQHQHTESDQPGEEQPGNNNHCPVLLPSEFEERKCLLEVRVVSMVTLQRWRWRRGDLIVATAASSTAVSWRMAAPATGQRATLHTARGSRGSWLRGS